MFTTFSVTVFDNIWWVRHTNRLLKMVCSDFWYLVPFSRNSASKNPRSAQKSPDPHHWIYIGLPEGWRCDFGKGSCYFDDFSWFVDEKTFFFTSPDTCRRKILRGIHFWWFQNDPESLSWSKLEKTEKNSRFEILRSTSSKFSLDHPRITL